MAALQKKNTKRLADDYLTDQNWDREEEEEKKEVGIFKEASEEVLAKRTFKKAKRKGTSSSETTDTTTKTTSNPFSGFGGFGGFVVKPTSTPVPTTIPVNKEVVPEQKSNFWSGASMDFFANRGDQKVESKDIPVKTNMFNTATTNAKTDDTASKTNSVNDTNDAYFEQLVSLNHSVLAWIKQHVDKNPCIDLTPVFNDYQKHLKELESKYSTKTKNSGVSQPLDNNANMFKTPDSATASPVTCIAAATKVKSIFTSSTPIQRDGAFPSVPKFGASGLFTTSPLAAKTESEKKVEEKSKPNTDENEEETNPVPERTVIVEKDAFHQIRCKLFFKKGASFQELGMGMLYLKPSGEKVQLLVRMETTTGKVLLNICISDDMPISRNGKNNVLLVSVPNPPVYSKPADGDNSIPCTYLIRVKGNTEADELLSKMKPT